MCITRIFRKWSKYTQIDANAWGTIKEATSLIKTYFGNYNSMVYWFDNPDLKNDVAGESGTIESVSSITSTTETGIQILLDADMNPECTGVYHSHYVRDGCGGRVCSY